ncbi:MAG: (d)CMP kinase [Polyangiaceae bacterium]|nr:(d)CMP kinase [Polyangiaceae bacterium]MCW5791232.1 (d)CMP kinase [Polyangiaceae bacterium]
MRARPVVAIDGPAGAGKTSVSQRVAEALGYLRLDTGALYRSVALAALIQGVGWRDEAGLTALTEALAARGGIRFEVAPGGEQRVLLDGEDVTARIREQRVGEGASFVSAMPGVRAALLSLQRSQAAEGGVVLEGRDIGTVVFPDAEAKFFLTADTQVRAARRLDELRARGEVPSASEVEAEVRARDARDMERAVAPLRQAEDALLVDSSRLDLEQVVALIVERVRQIEAALR